jgi:hypothetical protein
MLLTNKQMLYCPSRRPQWADWRWKVFPLCLCTLWLYRMTSFVSCCARIVDQSDRLYCMTKQMSRRDNLNTKYFWTFLSSHLKPEFIVYCKNNHIYLYIMFIHTKTHPRELSCLCWIMHLPIFINLILKIRHCMKM